VKNPKEELRLITSESELRVGMLLYDSHTGGRWLLIRKRKPAKCGICHVLGPSWDYVGPHPGHDEPLGLCCPIAHRTLYEVREKGQSDDNERREILNFQKDAEMRIRKPADVRDR
jgi:hypothetical protein